MHKNVQMSSEKLGAKFPATTRSYSMVKIASLDDAFSEFFERKASPAERKKKEKKERRKNIKIGKPKELGLSRPKTVSKFDFCACPSRNVVNGMLVERKA